MIPRSIEIKKGQSSSWLGRKYWRDVGDEQGGESFGTHINSNMTHDALMMRQADILAVARDTFSIIGTLGARFVVDDEGALDVDLDGTWIGNGLFEAAGTCTGSNAGVRGSGRRFDGGSHGGIGRGRCRREESKIHAIETVEVAIRSKGFAVPSLTAYISFCPLGGRSMESRWNRETAED